MKNYCDEQNDNIENKIYETLDSFVPTGIAWDMSIIGDIADFIEKRLLENNEMVCRPWYDDNETPCYITNERCEYCRVQN